METGYDYGSESEKLGGVPGVLRLKSGDEFTLLVTGPMVECQDRFGSDAPKTKYALGIYNVTARERGIVLLSWKSKKEWDEENKKRPFSKHLVRYSRVGSGQNDTRYTVVSVGPIGPSEMSDLSRAPSFDVRACAAEITRRAMVERAAPVPAQAQAPRETYAHPGNGAPVQAAPASVAAAANATYAPVTAAAAPPASPAVDPEELVKIASWLDNPTVDIAKVSEYAKKVMLDALGRDRVLAVCAKVGIVRGGAPPTVAQLKAACAATLEILRPTPVMAGMGIADDSSLPF